MSVFDHNLSARVLLTLMTIGYGGITILADFNATHATNPKWTPHARFHVVWQIASYTGFGLVALALIWAPGPMPIERLYVAGLMGTIVYAAFFVALFSMPLYGGRSYDDNGYLPFKAPVAIFAPKWDVNVTVFSVLVLILIAGVWSISGAGTG